MTRALRAQADVFWMSDPSSECARLPFKKSVESGDEGRKELEGLRPSEKPEFATVVFRP